MKNLLSFLAATFVACLAFCGYATDNHWTYSSGQISDGDWVFTATVSGNNLTVKTPVDDSCPTVVTALDFSKDVIDGDDPAKKYTIVELSPNFGPYSGSSHSSKDFVGELALPGEGLKIIGDCAFRNCSNLTGDMVFPTSLTSTARGMFMGTKITSATFKAAAATISGGYSTGTFQNCTDLKWVKFDAEGHFNAPGGFLFPSCSSLGDADLSGVTNVMVSKSDYAVFYNSGALTNLTLNSCLVITNTGAGTIGNALFRDWSNTKLATIRFTGAAPDELPKWISGDSGFLGCLKSTQSIATIVPAEYRNVKNSSGKSWVDYSASGLLNTSDSTWAAGNVKSDVSDLSKRKLLLDKAAEDDPPSLNDPVVSNIGAYQATITANGSGLRGGTVFISLTNSIGAVTGPAELDDFGKSHTFTGLAYSTQYSVIVVATNKSGSVTNATCSFTTLEKPPCVSVEKVSDADEKTCTAGFFSISRDTAKTADLEVNYTMSGTATNGQSYATLSGTATIPANATSVTVEVTPLYNPYMRADATATMTITTDAAYEIDPEKGAAAITIVDGGILGASVAKGGDADFNKSQNGSFVISRASGDETVYPLTVKCTVGGTAVAGTDYTAIATSATIPAGSSSVTVSVVPLFCETKVEGDTHVDLSLVDDPAYTVGTRDATVNVAKVEVRHYSITAGVGPIGNTRGTFIVSRGANDPIDQKVTLSYTVSGDGASAIYALSGTVVIPAYATSATIEVFANNGSGSDAQLVVTLNPGAYVLDSNSANITVSANAASEYWLVTTTNTIVWGGWTFNVTKPNTGLVSCSGGVPGYPAEISPLDFSLPFVDANGNRYTITSLSMRDASAEAKSMAGELTLPGEGFTGFGYTAFSGCTNLTGTLVFPTTCTGLGGGAFNNCSKLKILGRSVANLTNLGGADIFPGVSFVGEVLAVSLTSEVDGGFSGSKIESVRFGPGLKKLGRASMYRSGFFQNCTSLTNVAFDSASEVSLEMGSTFRGCTALQDLDLSAVTNITCGYFLKSGSPDYVFSTFYGCTSLTNVTFGENLQYIASNSFEGAFRSLTAPQSVTFKGLPPENLELPFLSKLSKERNPEKVYVYPTVTTYVHRDMVSTKNAAGKCWNDYAADGEISSSGTTWASDYLPSEITDLSVRPLLTIEQGEKKKGFMIFVR